MPDPELLAISQDLRPGERDAVVDGLVSFNRARGFPWPWRDCDFVLRDAAGRVRGGALAETNAGWCFVKALWVDEALRGLGHGRRLLAAVEDAARARGGLGVYLDTYSFQARPFYERAGYRVFGTLPDHPPGGAKYYLAKRFDEGAASPVQAAPAGATEVAPTGAAEPAAGPDRLVGRVQPGKGDASRWLARFNAAYARKVGMPVFPGSLNLALAHVFDWFAPAIRRRTVWFDRAEYGGERDILLVSCRLVNLRPVGGGAPAEEPAWLWSPTTAARDRPDPWVVEVIAAVPLRATYGLADGALVEVELRAAPPDVP